MKAKDVIKFWIYDDTNWIEYTDGILKIDIVRGAQTYQGPFTQPDVGQLRVVSRNDQLDPYLNETVRFGSKVKVTAELVTLFTGTIDGIDVEYRPKGQDPQITINCIDMIGTMQKHVLSDAFIKTRPQTWTTDMLLQDLDAFANTPGYGVPGFNCVVRLNSGNNYVRGSINSGTTAWAALSTRAATDLGFVYANCDNNIYYYELPYDNANHPNMARPVHIYFEYDGSGTSYLDIKLNDGFENIVNKLSFSNSFGTWNVPGLNTYTTTSYSESFENEDSVSLWGPSTKTVNFLSNADYVNEQKDKIFTEMSYPQRDIAQITWDGTKNIAEAKNVDILDNINVNHQLSNSISINRKYSVIGIKHDITESDWRITYVLRNWNFIETSMAPVTVIATPESGDTNTDWSFAVDTTEPITSYLWDMDDGKTSTLANPTNIDYNTAGTKDITVTVTNVYGWTKTSPVKNITVVGAGPVGVNVTYTVDSLGYYTFTAGGEGATNWYWNFGDGYTAGGQVVTHNFESVGTFNVLLQANNSYGSVNVTTPITITSAGVLPIRYIKFVWDFMPETSTVLVPNKIKQLKVLSGSTNRLLNKPITSIKTYYTNLQDSTAGTSGNLFLLPAAQYYLTDNNNTNNWLFLDNLNGVNNNNSTYYTYAEINYDLGATYGNLNGCQAILDLAAPGAGQSYGPIKVYASEDNTNWVLWGTITPSSTNGGYVSNAVCNIVGNKTFPYTYPAAYVTFTSYPTIPVRYIKANVNKPANQGEVLIGSLYAFAGKDQYNDITTDPAINTFAPDNLPLIYASSNVNSGSCTLNGVNWTGGYELTNKYWNDATIDNTDSLRLFGGSSAINVDLILDLGKIRDDIWTVGILHKYAGLTTPDANNAYVNWSFSTDGVNWTTIKSNHILTSSSIGSGVDSDFITNSPRGFFVTPLTTAEWELPNQA